MKRSIIVLSIFLVLWVFFNIAIAVQTDNALELEKLIEEAVNNNPQLKSFEESVNSLKEKPSQERSWDNPSLKLAIMNLPNDTFEFDQEPMTQKKKAFQKESARLSSQVTNEVVSST